VELPVAEGASVKASSKVTIVMAGLQLPKDVTSLGVEGLVVVCTCHVAPKIVQKTWSQLQR
jgi:hypothetical protein